MALLDPILGSASATSWKGYSVKGNLVAARATYVRTKWGEEGVRAVLGRLSGEPKQVFESQVLPFKWFSFELLATIDDAIIHGPMGGDVSLMKPFGNEIARSDLSTVYKMLLKLGSPSFVIKRSGVVYGAYVRGGAVAAVDVGPKHARTALMEGTLPMYFCAHGVPGWFSAALELSGGKKVDVKETACVHRGSKRCEWSASWV
jgi:hypothetical protein